MNLSDRPRRPFGVRAYLLMVLAVVVIGAVAGGAGAIAGDLPGLPGLILTVAATTVAMGAALAGCVWWWRGIDEAAREAHKWAWWWGGSGGMAVGGVLMLTLGLRDDRAIPGEVALGAADLVSGGASIILLFQLAGYGVAWAAWWLKHR